MILHAQIARNHGFMLIEVLIALALFGLSAVYLVDGAFVAFIRRSFG